MHFSCLVIVPEGEDPESTVKTLIEPHREQHDGDEYTGWWDWYRIGGRWDGHFLGLEKLDEDSHYSDAWEQLSRNSAPANVAGEWDTYRVLSPEGCKAREEHNPAWDGVTFGQSDSDVSYMRTTADYMQWRAEQLIKYRDGIVVVVDYHS